MQNKGSVFLKYRIFIGAIAVLFVGVVMALGIASNTGFRVLNTNPSISDMHTITPFLKVTFSEPLAKDGLSVSADPDIIDSTGTDGSRLTITLKVPTTENTTYKITVNSVTSTKGNTIKNKTFTFKPSYTNPASLSDDQEKILKERDNNKPYNVAFITFNGTGELQKRGITSDQIDQFKNGMFQYFTSIRQNIKTVDIDPASVTTPPYNPEDPNTTFVILFDVTLDGQTPRKIRLDYTNLTAAQTRIYDATTNAQIFDSGMLSGQ